MHQRSPGEIRAPAATPDPDIRLSIVRRRYVASNTVPHTRFGGCVAILAELFSITGSLLPPRNPRRIMHRQGPGEIRGHAQPPMTPNLACPQPLQQRIKQRPPRNPERTAAQDLNSRVSATYTKTKQIRRHTLASAGVAILGASIARDEYERTQPPGSRTYTTTNQIQDHTRCGGCGNIRYLLPASSPARSHARRGPRCDTGVRSHPKAQPPNAPTVYNNTLDTAPHPLRRVWYCEPARTTPKAKYVRTQPPNTRNIHNNTVPRTRSGGFAVPLGESPFTGCTTTPKEQH
ncbi:hypothetical protein BS47DRAFT_96900 [Hydnum rufescens UP504]|uniref:Uncharacterized protein n=1 Tax=Hydnum rufescens UP504 TaxID=1448309 RepID=A0A9P6ARI8_9AGAM|nr:hypothetical protein BS47DRAFT_96900 [Hydnum rufescens UP504]